MSSIPLLISNQKISTDKPIPGLLRGHPLRQLLGRGAAVVVYVLVRRQPVRLEHLGVGQGRAGRDLEPVGVVEGVIEYDGVRDPHVLEVQ